MQFTTLTEERRKNDHLNRCKKKVPKKIQFTFMVKTLRKLEIERNTLNLINGIYQKQNKTTEKKKLLQIRDLGIK